MAIETGQFVFDMAQTNPNTVDWLIHSGSGYQGSTTWPAHHAIQAALVGRNGTAFELRQFCSGGLTSWIAANSMRSSGRTAICTSADNWSWGDRFTASRKRGGSPFSDAAHCAVLSDSGFARIVSSASGSLPELADDWRLHDRYWDHIDMDQFGLVLGGVMQKRDTATTLDFAAMCLQVINMALLQAGIPGRDISHFIPPPGAGHGGIYHRLARIAGLPWDQSTQDFYLDHGYLAGSAQVAALVNISSNLAVGSTVLMISTEYSVGCTAVVLQIESIPTLEVTGRVSAIR